MDATKRLRVKLPNELHDGYFRYQAIEVRERMASEWPKNYHFFDARNRILVIALCQRHGVPFEIKS